MTDPDRIHLAVALDGAGWHPAAWRAPDARPDDLLDAGYWTDLVQEAERGLVDLVTIEDSFGLQSEGFDGPGDRLDHVRGRLDAVLIAARVAPTTQHVGLVPTATVTHTEPFHVSKAIATLDYVSSGRAGWRAQTSRPYENALFGRRQDQSFTVAELQTPEGQAILAEHFDEAADHIEVVRRLWDSWEDDAEIRDAATGRFIDREKLHYIDFEGRSFSVKGPSITPRPPQGQPLVTLLAHSTVPYRLGARAADVVFVTPRTVTDAVAITAEVRREQEQAGRAGEPLHVFGDLVVFLDESHGAAERRKAGLDALDGAELSSDALVFTGTAAELADLLEEWSLAGLSGFRLRPGTIPTDLEAVTRTLVPELQRRGRFRTGYEPGSLRERLGLSRPASRYAATA